MTLEISDVIKDTVELIQIDSQNPGPGEGECSVWLEKRLRRSGLDLIRQSVTTDRDNLVVSVAGRGSSPRLVLLAHMDTVPIGEGWTQPPLEGKIVDGRLYGRGACDMKAGLALALNLIESVDRIGGVGGDIVLCLTCDEEAPDMLGVHALVEAGIVGTNDQVLALEPTGLRLRIAQMGLRWLELTVHGKMAHAGRAHLGIDANHVMARVIDRLKQAVKELPYEDALLGRPRFTAGVVKGGVATNVVPPSCRAELDLRLVPPMTPEAIVDLASSVAGEIVEAFPGARFEIKPLGAARPPVRASDDALIVTRLKDAYQTALGKPIESGGADGHEAYTDASMVAALTNSSTCTVFGPGSSDLAHTADEFVPIEDIQSAARVLELLVKSW
jgi:succinyl-diaminopimelate desuccinylase